MAESSSGTTPTTLSVVSEASRRGMSSELDSMDRRLLNRLQKSFPLEERPFAVLGTELGLAEGEALERTRRLKAGGLIREVSAIFEAQALGYQSTLVAMGLPPAKLDEAGAYLSRHPGVSHNYARTHHYNLWFTLALPQEKGLAAEVERLARGVGAWGHLLLPMVRLFKIGVFFDMVEGTVAATDNQRPVAACQPLSTTEKALVRQLQEDLPLDVKPFSSLAQSLGMSPGDLLARVRDMETRGVMRRYAAVLRHHQAGFLANAMVCWVVPGEQVEEVGLQMSTNPAVTHCYQRPTYPEWPYALFTMIHGKTEEECRTIAAEMTEAAGVEPGVLLFSTREYKKARPKYFVDEAGG